MSQNDTVIDSSAAAINRNGKVTQGSTPLSHGAGY